MKNVVDRNKGYALANVMSEEDIIIWDTTWKLSDALRASNCLRERGVL